jgi:hypothetical protein
MMSLLLLGGSLALAQSRLPNQQNSMEGPATGFGVGAVVGTPSGLALSWRPSPTQAVQAATGFSGQQGRFAANIDYIRTVWAFFNADESWIFPLYVGGGIRYRTLTNDEDKREADQSGIGLRVPVGVRVYPEDTRLDLFAEVAPALHFSPSPTVAVDFGIGVRLWAGGKEK